MRPVALTIRRSDPSGGAGIQADLKTFHQFGVYGEAVLTLLTVQNTTSVDRVDCLTPEFVLAQLHAVLDDIPPGAAKTGALGNAGIVEAIADAATRFTFPLVVDPVMISKHGAALVSKDARAAIAGKLIPLAVLITPNLQEAAALTGIEISQRGRDARGGEAASRDRGAIGSGEGRTLGGRGDRYPPRWRRLVRVPGASHRYGAYAWNGMRVLSRDHGRSWPAARRFPTRSRGRRRTSGRPSDRTQAWGADRGLSIITPVAVRPARAS